MESSENSEELSIEPVNVDNAPSFDHEMKLAILNASIITNLGSYVAYPIPLSTAKLLVNSMRISSHVGHESTATLLSDLLDRPIGYSRKELKQSVGQMALVFKLKKRAPEGKILSRDMLEDIGYEFWIVYRTQ